MGRVPMREGQGIMSINRVNISGNLTRDPELRSTQGGTQICNFGVAVNDRRRNPQTGEWEDYPNFIDCVVFGNRADALNRLLSKGMKVAVEGKLRWSQWQDRQTGQNRSKIEVIVDEVEFLSQRNYQGQDQQGGYQRQPQQQPRYQSAPQAPQMQQAPSYGMPPQDAPVPAAPSTQAPPSADVYDEDIPF